MANPRPPAWFRMSTMINRPLPPTPVDPTPTPVSVRPPVPVIIRPSFSIRPPPPQSQDSVPIQAPPPTVPPATRPPMAIVRPSFVIRPPSTPNPTPTPPAVALPAAVPQNGVTPPRSPVLPPERTVSAPRSPISPPASAAAPPKSPIKQTLAPPPSPPAPPRSPVLHVASPPRSRAATPPPAAKTPPANYNSPLSTYKNSPPSSSPTVSPRMKIVNPASSVPNSPIPKHVSTESSSKTLNEDSNHSLGRSPTTKPLSRPPSPLALPPAQIKTDDVEHETVHRPMRLHNHHNIATAASHDKREPLRHNRGTHKKNSEYHEQGTMVITLAGENRGAIMELSPSQQKSFPIGNPHTLNNGNKKVGSVSSRDQSSSESGEEGLNRNKDKNRRAIAMQPPPTNAYLNSNVQGVNNSILYNFTYAQNDPGVHLSLNRKANGSRHKA